MKKAAPPPAAKPKARPQAEQSDLIKAALADREAKQMPGPGAPRKPAPGAGQAGPRPAGSGKLPPLKQGGSSKPPPVGPDGKPLPLEEEPVVYTAPAASRDKDLKKRLARDLAMAVGALVLLAGAFYSPPGQSAYGTWLTRRAADNLSYTTVSMADVGGGTAQLKLPDGSTRVADERTHQQVFRYDHMLELGNGKSSRVAFDATGYAYAIDDALTLNQKTVPALAIVKETHNYKKFRAVHVPQGSGGQPHSSTHYYQLQDRDENVFSLMVTYDENQTDPKAMAAVLDHVLGSVQE